MLQRRKSVRAPEGAAEARSAATPMSRAALPLLASVLVLSCATALALKLSPDQTPSLPGDGRPLGGGKPVATTTIKRCPDGRELVVRLNGALGCAKDIVPPND